MKHILRILFPLSKSKLDTFELPRYAKFLHFGSENNMLAAWFEVDSQHEVIEYHFALLESEASLDFNVKGLCPIKHLATQQCGHNVTHLYEMWPVSWDKANLVGALMDAGGDIDTAQVAGHSDQEAPCHA